MPRRMNAGIWIILFCQPDYSHVIEFWWGFFLFREGAYNQSFLVSVCLTFEIKQLYLYHILRRHCYINPLVSWTFRLATVVTANSQVVITEFHWYRSRDVWLHVIKNTILRVLCVFVIGQMSMYCSHCIEFDSLDLFWSHVSVACVLTFPVWTKCRCLWISWVNIKVIWQLSYWTLLEH